MSDISKCEGEGCEVRSQCVRFMAPRSRFHQSYICPSAPGMACDYYWPVDGPGIG